MTNKKCWICGEKATTREHRIKKSDIISKYGKGTYKGKNEICIYEKNKNLQMIRGANSTLLKYDKILCSNCNNSKTQLFDRAYEKFIIYINENKNDILYKRFINFSDIYKNNMEEGQRNLYKYFVKSFGSRLAHFGYPISQDIIDLLDLDKFQTGLRLNFAVNEDKLYFGNLDNNLRNMIGNGAIFCNQSFVDKTANIEYYTYNEYYDWLHINYYYNQFPDGNLGSTWIADNQFIYLGSSYSNLTDDMREEMCAKAQQIVKIKEII